MNIEAKSLPDGVITFRRYVKPETGKAYLVPMLNGVDLPLVHAAQINEIADGMGSVVITLCLPNGVIVE